MYSLSSYKEQVYNLGSPLPSPTRSPLKSLPKADKTEDFVFLSPSVTKAPNTPSRNLKRKCVTSKVSESPKKPKIMTPQQMEDLLVGLQSTLSKLDEKMETFSKKLDTQDQKHEVVNVNVTALNANFENFKQAMETNNKVLEDKMNTMEGEFVKLHDKVETSVTKTTEEVKAAIVPIIENEVAPKLKEEVKHEILKTVDGTWKAQLAEKVKEHEKSLIVFGFQVTMNPFDDAIELIENVLKVDKRTIERILMTGAIRLGQGGPNKPPPLLINFSCSSDRNLILSFSKNLKNTKISIEKHVPKIYQAEYKRFKNIAQKLRLLPETNYQTQISFDSHLMLLRYKARDTATQKFQYTTHSEYYPPMSQAASDLKSSLHIPPGTIPTPVITPDVRDRVNNSFTMSGMTTERTQETFERQFKEYVKTEDRSSIVGVKLLRKNMAVIYCKTWEDCNRIISHARNTKFENEKVFFSMFSEENPKMG